MDYSVYIIVWIVCGIAALLIAQSKGAPNTLSWFLVGVLLGPIGVILAVIGAKGPPKTAAAAYVAPTGNVADELSKLVALRNAGELSQAEFDQHRARLMGPGSATPTWPSATPAVALQTAASPAIAEAKGGTKVAERVVLVLIVLTVIVGAIIVVNGARVPSLGSADSSTGIPPAGSIWFGSSFNPDTMAISGQRLSTVGANQGFSFVAHLTRSMDSYALLIQTSWNGQLVSTTSVNATGSSDLWGFTPGPLFEAGVWKFELTDIGGNTLASGSITATP